MVQDQLLSNIAADHHEEPGEVVALVSNPLQPDQVDTCSLYWTQYTLLVFSNIDIDVCNNFWRKRLTYNHLLTALHY